MDVDALLALVPAKYASYVAAVIAVAAVVSPLLPAPAANTKGVLGSATYKALYVALHWFGQNRDKVHGAMKQEEAATAAPTPTTTAK